MDICGEVWGELRGVALIQVKMKIKSLKMQIARLNVDVYEISSSHESEWTVKLRLSEYSGH